MANDLTEEVTQRALRMNNLVVSGIPELSDDNVDQRKEHDEETFKEVLKTLGLQCNQISGVFHIGNAHQDRPRLLKVTICDARAKQEILRNSKKLYGSKSFKNVFINNDLTPL